MKNLFTNIFIAFVFILSSSKLFAQASVQTDASDSVLIYTGGTKTVTVSPSGQMRIGSTGPINANAMLQLNSTNQGLLLPRLTGAIITAMTSVPAGMIVYNTTTTKFVVFDGTSWNDLLTNGASGWGLTGNSGTVDGTNFIGTTDDVPLTFKVGNQFSGYISSSTGTTAAFGYGTLRVNTANYNAAFGHNSMGNTTTGGANTALGFNSLASNVTGSSNTAVGFQSLLNNTSNDNTAVGYMSLGNNTNGSQNSALGLGASYNNTIGSENVVIGAWAQFNNVAGSKSVAIGHLAMYNANNQVGAFNGSNVAIGYEALKGSAAPAANTGNENTAVGYQSMLSNTSGSVNTALGIYALSSNTTGSYNTATGYSSMSTNTTGDRNTSYGFSSLNTNTTGTNNTAFGYGADVTSSSLTNANAFGYNAKVATSNSLVLGGTGADAVNVGIGTTSPSNRLHVEQNQDIDKHTIYGLASQPTPANDYQNVGVTGFASSDANAYGYGVGVLGFAKPSVAGGAGLYGGIGVYAGLNSTVPSPATPNNYYAFYADAGVESITKYSGVFLNGSVGIGTATPSTLLDVTGDGGTILIPRKSTTGDPTGINGMIYYNTADAKFRVYQNNAWVSAASGGDFKADGTVPMTGNIQLNGNYLSGDGGNEGVSVDGSGNVGIGTSTPNNLFQVANYINFNPTYSSTSLGYTAGNATAAAAGTFVGYAAGTATSTGDANTYVGFYSGNANTSGRMNTFVGANAGVSNTVGQYNTYLGSYTAYNMLSGTDNTFLGSGAGSTATVGNYNTFVGENAGGTIANAGTYNTFLGYNASGTTGLTNATSIGYGATVTANNSLVLGNSANVGIGISNPSYKLHIVGDLNFTGALRLSGSSGTSAQVLHGNAAGSPTFSAVSLTADVTGTLPITNGGTNNSALAVTNGGVVYTDGTKMMNVGVGTSGQFLKSNGAVAPTWATPPAHDYAIYEDQKASGTGGGNFTPAGSWLTRTLNTVVSSSGTSITLAANQVTLAAGTYYIRASAPAYNVSRHAIRLQNITDATTAILGSSEFLLPNGAGSSNLEGVITVAASKTFQVQHRCQTADALGLSLGVSSSFGVNEVYTHIYIEKIQ